MKFLKLLGFVLLVELLGASGSIFTSPKIGTWYAGLVKPSFSPPNWIFAPVWTLLFALMGIAVYLVWQKRNEPAAKNALWIFAGHFALNILWSFLFFGLNSPLLGLIGIILLWLAIVAVIWSFAKISKTAAWLLLPYILWVSFAAFLNFSIWQLN